MVIRPALLGDLDVILGIFDRARRFMAGNGNGNQWINGYPSAELMVDEIGRGCCFVCLADGRRIAGVFCFAPGPDPTYGVIDDGAWLNDRPYGVIHRLASDGSVKGLADACIAWCLERCGDIRADTHADNGIMQHILLRNGFIRCGTVVIKNGTRRIAFQKTAR